MCLQDKLGPMCRSIADCAVIFDVLRGQDNLDPTSRDSALLDPVTVNVSQLTVGYLPGMDKQVPEVHSAFPNLSSDSPPILASW